MKRYEGMFILKPDMSKEAKETVIKSIEDTITKNGGKVEACKEWGRRHLAFTIKKHVEGEYHICDFEAKAESIKPIQNIYKLNDDILRSMIIAKE